MKKLLLLFVCCFLLVGCGGVSQGEYDKVVKERDELQKKYDNSEKQGEITQNKNDNLEDYQEPEPFFCYSGNGDDVVNSGIKTEAVSFAKIKHNGDGHFSVKAHCGSSYDLLVNTTDPYDGTTLLMPNNEYVFEVSAKGEWTIELYKLGTSSTDSFSGNSDFVTPIFLKTSEVYEVKTSGRGHFSIKGWGNYDYDLLVNTTDENYSGKIMFNNGEKYGFFEINADRDWSIIPVNGAQ